MLNPTTPAGYRLITATTKSLTGTAAAIVSAQTTNVQMVVIQTDSGSANDALIGDSASQPFTLPKAAGTIPLTLETAMPQQIFAKAASGGTATLNILLLGDNT